MAGDGVTGPAATAVRYRLAGRHLGRGRIGDLLAADLRVMLAGAAYTPADADEWLSAVTAYESAGPGYPPGGAPLQGRSFDYEAAAASNVLRCDPLLFPAAGFVCRYAVLYVATGDPAGSPLLSRVDFGVDIGGAGDDLPIPFPDGILHLG